MQHLITQKEFPELFENISLLPSLKYSYPTLFHATTISAAKSILQHGLLTSKCGFIHGEMAIRPPEKTIYLSKHESSNNLNSELFTQNQDIVILEVSTNMINENNIFPDDAFFCGFANEDYLVDHFEVAEVFNISLKEAEKFFNVICSLSGEELVEFTKPLWNFYLIQEGEISVAQDIPKQSIINIRDYNTGHILNLSHLKKNKP